MKRINSTNINSEKYWDENIAEPDFGLRQKKYLELAGEGEHIIELGCGLSPFLDKARENFKECYGADFSHETIGKARNKFHEVDYYICPATDTPFPEKYFDVSVAGELIEHLEEPEKLIAEMIRITKQRIILSTAIMEYNDPEHLWEFEEKDFPMGKTEIIESERFPRRKYLFITIDL